MSFNLWYDISSYDPADRDVITKAARRLAPSGGTLTTCLLADDGTGEVAYAMGVQDWQSIDDGELFEFLSQRCTFDKHDDDPSGTDEDEGEEDGQ